MNDSNLKMVTKDECYFVHRDACRDKKVSFQFIYTSNIMASITLNLRNSETECQDIFEKGHNRFKELKYCRSHCFNIY